VSVNPFSVQIRVVETGDLVATVDGTGEVWVATDRLATIDGPKREDEGSVDFMLRRKRDRARSRRQIAAQLLRLGIAVLEDE
jgi:hypothetical protein